MALARPDEQTHVSHRSPISNCARNANCSSVLTSNQLDKVAKKLEIEGRANHADPAPAPRRKLKSVQLTRRMSSPNETQLNQRDDQEKEGRKRFVSDAVRWSSRRIPSRENEAEDAKKAQKVRLQSGSVRQNATMSLNGKIQLNDRTLGRINPRQLKPIRPLRGHIEPHALSNWFAASLLVLGVAILSLATCSTATTNQLKAQLVTASSSVSPLLVSNEAASVSVSSHKSALDSVRGRFKRSRTQPTGPSGGARGLRPSPSSKPSNRQQSEAESVAQQQPQHHAAGRSIRNVTAQNGQDALLHCLIEPNAAGEYPEVSWFRGLSEPQLLTYDTTTIIMDERFLVRRGNTRPNDWALQIKGLNKSQDAGLYHCQTGGESGQLQSYQLNIVEPRVDILGAPDLTVRVGSPVNLTCVISQSADELQFVFWYHDERMINYDDPEQARFKIVLSKWSQQRDSITSNLQIFQSRPSDSGNYTCTPSGARSSSIQVHVLQEATDKRLMMFQQDESNALAASSQQTNSAISQHVIRLGRGRAYAFLVGLFILATWFQLIAQLQTLVSLALIAIIGLLLGQRNSHHEHQRRRKSSSFEHLDHEKLAIRHKQDEELLKSSGPASNLKAAASLGQSLESVQARDDHKLNETTNRGSDQLLRGAEEALSLLKTLGADDDEDKGRALSCSSSIEFGDEDEDETKFRSLSFGALDERHRFASAPPDQRRRRRQPTSASSQPEEQLTIERPMLMSDIVNNDIEQLGPRPSPSSSSCSPNSTGYNSDSTRRCSSSAGANCLQTTPTAAPPHPARKWTPNVSLLDERCRADEGSKEEIELLPEPNVIELIRGRPTAMRLIIEQLQRTGELAPDWTSSMGRGSGRRAPDETLYASPVASKQNPATLRNNADDDDDCQPLDLSQAELAKRSASATFQRPD